MGKNKGKQRNEETSQMKSEESNEEECLGSEFKQVFSYKKAKIREKSRKKSLNQTFQSKRKALEEKDLENLFNGFGLQLEEQQDHDIQLNQPEKKTCNMIDGVMESEYSYSSLTEDQFIQVLNKFLLNWQSDLLDQSDESSEWIKFLTDNKLLLAPNCKQCHSQMKMGNHKQYSLPKIWRCYDTDCNLRKTRLFAGNPILSECGQVDIPVFLKALLYYIPCQVSNQTVMSTLDISSKSLLKLKKIFYKALKAYYLDQYSKMDKLGKTNVVVEIDESCFRRKYHRGRLLKTSQQWIFGVTERNGGFKRTILLPVAKRNSEILIPLIIKFISKECKFIASDSWAVYRKLSTLGFSHKMVNHKKNFVQPKANQKNKRKGNPRRQNYQTYKGEYIHTQNIENRWCHIKNRLRLIRGKRFDFLGDVFATLYYLQEKKTIISTTISILASFIKNNLEQV